MCVIWRKHTLILFGSVQFERLIICVLPTNALQSPIIYWFTHFPVVCSYCRRFQSASRQIVVINMSHVFRCFTMSGRNLSEKRVCFKRSKQVGGVLCKMRVKCDIRALSLNQSCLYLKIKYQFGFRLLVAMGIAIWLPQHVI